MRLKGHMQLSLNSLALAKGVQQVATVALLTVLGVAVLVMAVLVIAIVVIACSNSSSNR